jgi:hypothetical protein
VPKRILIFANKTWEVEPLVAVFRSAEARPPSFPEADVLPQVTIPLNDGASKTVKARLAYKSASAVAEVWCIKDLMDPKKSSSSSEEKARVLPYVTANGSSPALTVAFGTAATPDQRSFNGSVVVGSNVFVYNPWKNNENPDSRWTHPDIGKLKDSSRQAINAALFGLLDRDQRASIESRFLSVPVNPGAPSGLILSPAYVALSDVNVTNYNDYAWADPEALRAIGSAEPRQSVGSMETTHGVIRLVVPSPQFIFVSGIANRLGYFNSETALRSYAQNFVASHNAGVALAWAMPVLMA